MHARQTISTHYLPATNTRGSRIVARASGGARLVVCQPCELDGVDASAYAAQKLADKLGWHGTWYVGGTRDGYVFVLALEDCAAFTVARG